ncbi:hypothetical protein HanRHA438_Chr14g0665781 [Helianthus annuus]|uniref:Uncharacterized protein n=1 Tax=Helianthus annuus TaxID=4232 RepID=A0A9K3EBC2_HELAN|nr:uncharacterized protein LOC110906029 [Helianthus annuus]KAF5770030.1 hypothetical protein HanXRQr2_Chr14g0654961 [Helianthus annuus]KAJ0464981.1 hypothetical protein HanHA300_Chr14g0533361 [Helianthus annuus]KAJ0486574.1 hypothetical protein HanHA89_Chr14g0581181 [Helianthus annuus]KAJ0657140.1 hypothetical protein HanLR1_Chr14g0543761 [Helianthus annuus]KAJ0660717.1 hypothetical protein HanOQP8_Chr14g0540861 [Helianthus annuus]
MKREGRQHGVVRSYPILPTPLSRQRRYIKTVDSASVTGLFTKVSSKPTNQSKFTGKCATARCLGCHIHPVCKSKDKAKGTMKLRSSVSNRELISCSDGTSAIDALAYLVSRESYDDDTADDYDYNDDDVGYRDDGWYFVGHFQ